MNIIHRITNKVRWNGYKRGVADEQARVTALIDERIAVVARRREAAEDQADADALLETAEILEGLLVKVQS